MVVDKSVNNGGNQAKSENHQGTSGGGKQPKSVNTYRFTDFVRSSP